MKKKTKNEVTQLIISPTKSKNYITAIEKIKYHPTCPVSIKKQNPTKFYDFLLFI